jgi:two-component system OmpR family response regulator
MRVLLVEDDPMIGGAVTLALKEAAYAVDWVRDGPAGSAALKLQAYGLVLLDLGLPKLDGLLLLKEVRSRKNEVPVVIVTARDDVDERIRGLDAGADDYVLKPFQMSELLARMRAVVRRKGGMAGPLLGNGTIALDPASHEASLHGRPVDLTAREFSLLHALALRPGAILSRSELEDRVYGWNEEVESNAIEFLIHGLRKKLGADAIKNVRGVGWMIAKGL